MCFSFVLRNSSTWKFLIMRFNETLLQECIKVISCLCVCAFAYCHVCTNSSDSSNLSPLKIKLWNWARWYISHTFHITFHTYLPIFLTIRANVTIEYSFWYLEIKTIAFTSHRSNFLFKQVRSFMRWVKRLTKSLGTRRHVLHVSFFLPLNFEAFWSNECNTNSADRARFSDVLSYLLFTAVIVELWSFL